MYYLSMSSQDIRTNLATEDYLLNKWDKQDPLLLFYRQKPSIILGKNQDYFAELNLDYVRKQQITVTRRLSGGGAVYDDLGNISFSIVTRQTNTFGNFKELTQPIVTALQELGVPAKMTGRNDLVVDGKKFSGNAMYQKGHKLFCHGTLMHDVDLTVLSKALNVPPAKLATHRVRSVNSRVTNFKEYLAPSYRSLTTAEFQDLLICQLFHVSNLDAIQDCAYHLTDTDKAEIAALTETRYRNTDWIQGTDSRHHQTVSQRFSIGSIEIRFNLKDNYLYDVRFYGDFFNQNDLSALEQAFEKCQYQPSAISATLSQFDLKPYFGSLSPSDLTALFFKELDHD